MYAESMALTGYKGICIICKRYPIVGLAFLSWVISSLVAGVLFYYPPDVLGVGSIPVEILPSCQDVKNIELRLYIYKHVKLGSENKKHFRSSTQATIHPLAIILTVMGLGQYHYHSLGEYYGPHTASSVFLILLFPPAINPT